jgi:type VI secretion system secreted protein Hcp
MAAVDYFLKIDTIPGESQDATHKGEIQLESWSWGETQQGTQAYGAGGGAGKVAMQDFHFVMKTNKASPLLFLACANGQHIPKATLTARKAGKEAQEYLKWIFTDLLISSYQTGGSAHSGDAVPTDQISFNLPRLMLNTRSSWRPARSAA